MSDDTRSQDDELSAQERARIRAEMRYAQAVMQEARPAEAPKTALSRWLAYLSNGFVLLLLGSLITSVLVPTFQRRYESRKQQVALMQECLSQFLLYSNTLWQEYYAVLPLTQVVEIDQPTYLQYVGKIADVKLKRYDAYAKVLALSVVFRGGREANTASSLDAAIKRYAVDLNSASASIDHWLTGLYSTPTARARSPCAGVDRGSMATRHTPGSSAWWSTSATARPTMSRR